MTASMQRQSGQIALVVLVVSAVVLTLGLSLSKKTVNEVKITTNEEMLKEAFNAAESGIDYYLSTGTTQYETTSSVGTTNRAQVNVTTIGNSNTINLGNFTEVGKPAYYWLVSHNADGTVGSTYYTGSQIDICLDNNYNGSVMIDYYYRDAGVYKVNRMGYNYGTAPNTVGNFSAAPGSSGSCSSNRGVRFTGLTGNPLLLVVTPIFTGSRISLIGNANFPQQGSKLESIGVAGVGSSQASVSTRVSQNNFYAVPEFLFWPISSGNNLVGAS